MTAILKYDAACTAIAEAKTVDEVSEWIDKAAAVREYGRRAKNRKLELDALEIRVKAKRRRGELLAELKTANRLREGRKKLSPTNDSLPVYSLDDLDLTANESSEDQAIAKIDGDSFARLVARCRAYAEANPEKHSINVLKPPPEGGPINGARTVMGSRVEPDDSLDYFPTPPWATRALLNHVLPAAGLAGKRLASAWEPACGEGHIAEVLAEYTDVLLSSDIHDYGYGQVFDFLGNDIKLINPSVDWIVTNPPFGKKTEPFVLRALEMAKVGVAMFVRMQWLETTGRYDRIYSKTPPTIIGFFAERVPLCKGEWKPEGDTATAYIWLVWIKGQKPQAPFWIPPNCRTDLELPDDTTRFVSHPVMTQRHEVRFAGADLIDVTTGEVIAERASPNRENALTPAQPEALPELNLTCLDPEAIDPLDPDNTGIPVFCRRVPRVESQLDQRGDGG